MPALHLLRVRWAECGASPPFIRPEPIIMTSPQGSIHFNYHLLSSVCVREPGKHHYKLRKVTDRLWDCFIWVTVKTGAYLCFREIWCNTRTGCPGQIVSLSTHLLNLSVCVCASVCAQTANLLRCCSVILLFKALAPKHCSQAVFLAVGTQKINVAFNKIFVQVQSTNTLIRCYYPAIYVLTELQYIIPMGQSAVY